MFPIQEHQRYFKTLKWVLLTWTRFQCSYWRINKKKDRKRGRNQPNWRLVVKMRWLFSAVLLDRLLPIYQNDLLLFTFTTFFYGQNENSFFILSYNLFATIQYYSSVCNWFGCCPKQKSTVIHWFITHKLLYASYQIDD